MQSSSKTRESSPETSNGDRLRIAFVGHRAMPSNYGGVEVYAEAVGDHLVKQGHTVLSFAAPAEAFDGSRYRGILVHTTGRINGKHIGALSQAFLSTLAACRSKADVIHFMAMGPTVFAPLVRLLSRRSVIVVTVAGRDDQRKKWSRVAKHLMKICFRVCIRVPDRIIAVSEDLADELRHQTPRPVIAVANGVSIPPRANPATRLPVETDLPFLLYAGRLVPEKRVDSLLRAFALVDTQSNLVIAGSGPARYTSMLKALAMQDERVRFIGHRSADEVDLLMRSAEMFVLPSELEGMPIALLEALGRGLPVVVSDLPCNREVFGRDSPGSRLVTVGDQQGLASAIEQTLENMTDARAAAAALSRHVRTAHQWKSVTRSVEEVYRDALAERGRSPCVSHSK